MVEVRDVNSTRACIEMIPFSLYAHCKLAFHVDWAWKGFAAAYNAAGDTWASVSSQ